jgi:FAD/FMN-containing dehydrogenase
VSGLIVYPFDQAKKVLAQYRDFVNNAPDDLSVWAVLRKAPPLPFLPPDIHGKEIVALAICSTMKTGQAMEAIEPLRRFGQPAGEHVGAQPYTAWQKAFDPLLTPGARNYWKSHNFTELSDGAIDTLVKYTQNLPSPESEIFLGALGGQTNRAAPDATAYPHRDVLYAMNVHTRWTDPAEDEKCIAWAREFFSASAPYAAGSVYINFLTQDEGERISEAYGKNFDRLVEAKNKYDPGNLFRQNQNIRPTV